MIPGFANDPTLVTRLAAAFDLRDPVERGLRVAVETLAGSFDTMVPQVLNLATGAGKTYLMAALIEYFRIQGVRNALVVTPSRVVQAKTVRNFTVGDPKYIAGGGVPPTVITPDSYDLWREQPSTGQMAVYSQDPLQLFVLNVQQMIPPKEPKPGKVETTRGASDTDKQWAFRKDREVNGNLLAYLRSLDDLVVIADEQHLYSDTAKKFQKGIADVQPAAVIGLTGSPARDDNVIYRYPLKDAIADGYVKRPVIAFRRGGYGEHQEEQQLRDALTLLATKQAAYETHAEVTGSEPVNAVLYVQCASVDHASQIAKFLRTPEYFGRDDAVLQVDNEHADAATLQLLDELDRPFSPIRAVVSVNKLREGWDVKNIAVMATLRAMASDVLTQQTMGRGLRLPFGQLTGVLHIDQLDILAHQAFTKALKSEEVLRQFGLENARGREPHTISPTPPAVAPGTEGTPDSTPTSTPIAPVAPGAEEVRVDDSEVVITVIEDDTPLTPEAPPEAVWVESTPRFAGATFTFPQTTMARVEAPFSLETLTDNQIDEVARAVQDSDDDIEREALTFTVRGIGTQATQQVKVGGLVTSRENVSLTLSRAILKLRSVPNTSGDVMQVKRRIVPRLMQHARVDTWTLPALQSAERLMRQAVERAWKAHEATLHTDVTITPLELPVASRYALPFGESIHSRLNESERGAGFVRGRHYGPWDQGRFEASSFDAYDTEYKIAGLLDRSPEVTWWKRLYPSNAAKIAFTVTRDYYPDFVALDSTGMYWIIEGKAQSGEDDQVVQDKRAAAEQTIRKLISDTHFADQHWGYLIAYQSDVRAAHSWGALRDSANPVTTPRYS